MSLSVSTAFRLWNSKKLNEISASYKGSISAEHGIGVMKTHALQYSKNSTSIELMKRIKALFDPNGIMNPGKVLP